jgi:hypothetical protein
MVHPDTKTAFASGDAGYVLNKPALAKLVRVLLLLHPLQPRQVEAFATPELVSAMPNDSLLEDVEVGRLLAAQGVLPEHAVGPDGMPRRLPPAVSWRADLPVFLPFTAASAKALLKRRLPTFWYWSYCPKAQDGEVCRMRRCHDVPHHATQECCSGRWVTSPWTDNKEMYALHREVVARKAAASGPRWNEDF